MATNFEVAANKTVDVGGTKFVFRTLGIRAGVPIVLLNHLTGVLDDWDPAFVDHLASQRPVVAFDNRGVGASEGDTPHSITAMAADAIAFINAIGLHEVDLLGFSLGGFIAQAVTEARPDLVRRIILAGTGPAGGVGIASIRTVLDDAIMKASATGRHPKELLFFSQSSTGQLEAASFLQRLQLRKGERDVPISAASTEAQLEAISAWGQRPTTRPAIRHPVLVSNGDNDVMVPTPNSFELARVLPHATLSIFPDAGHAGIFQYRQSFLDQAFHFLE